MIRKPFAIAAIAALISLAGVTARADLASYLRKPEPDYKWSKVSETHTEGGSLYLLSMVSQTWQGMDWTHKIQVFRPDKLEYPDFCTLLNTGGNPGPEETQIGLALATATGGEFAILYNIPNQPLYGGKTEDALVVYTWQKYMETGDDSWPLHFPMAKAVIKAMDTIQEFTKSQNQPGVNRFLITGASKRGWTTWLAGASRDPRIKAIAPMVIDTLNVAAQIPHQLAAYGKPSEQVGDYTAAGMLTALNTPAGKRLLKLEDPYSYRSILTLPKLLILGTNDRYWSQDSLNLYWDDLMGPKWVMYDPNSGHGLEDRVRVYATLSAFARSIASGVQWPRLQWQYFPARNLDGYDLTVASSIAPESARIFFTTSATQDFRDSKWVSAAVPVVGHGFTGHFDGPGSGYLAAFAEMTFRLGGKEFTLSTQIKIAAARDPRIPR